MKKTGFTISELFICLAIVGVLSGAIISSFNKYDKGIKHLYSNTFYVLDRALYNATAYWITGDAKNREPFKSQVVDPENPGTYIDIDDTEGAKRLCIALTEYINPAEGRDNLNCSASNAVTDTGKDELFSSDKVMFTATNGVRYWISKRYPDGIDEDGNVINEDKLKFFIVYADLNGKQNPNSMTYVPGSAANHWKTKDPDIFAFAALENGRICPLGIPEVEPRYMTTRVVYQEEGEDNEILLKYSEPSRPYYYSKAEAWGYYLPESKKPSSCSTCKVIKDDDVINDEPLSYNGYVQSLLSEGNKIYAFLGDKTMTEYVQSDPLNLDDSNKLRINFRDALPKHADNDRFKPNIGGYGCEWASDEECYVFVDKYLD